MNINDLKLELKKLNIPSDMYCLNGGLPNESYCINRRDDVWEVYYSERGQKSDLKVFNNETDACFHIHSLILKAINYIN